MNEKHFSVYNILVIISILSITFPSLESYSQNYTYSPYSVYGLGILENNGVSENFGAGSAGIAIPSDKFLNITNPASYSGLDSSSFLWHLGLFSKFSEFNSQTSSLSSFGVGIRYLALGFKIKKWWGFGASLIPFSTRGYKIFTTNYTDGYNDTYQEDINGSGSINKFNIGNSFQISENISIGINCSYLFGSLIQEDQVSYPSIQSYGVDLKTTSYFQSILFDMGLQYQLIIGENKLLAGITFSPRQKISSRYDKLITNNKDTLENDLSIYDQFTLPIDYGIGLGFLWKNQIKLMTDFHLQKWSKSNYKYESANFADSWKLNTGIEYIPERKNSHSYRKAIIYRLGFRYEKSYLILSNNQLSETAVSMGIGLPLSFFNFSKLNVALELGKQGTLKNQLIQENYARITLGLTFQDILFKHPKIQ
jgi:hypothetical protein